MTVMPEFDPLAILDKVNRISDAEIARSKAEWRALYGELDPFAVAPFVKYGAPLSNEGRRLASLLNRALHGRLPVTADIRFELVQFLSARLSDPTKDIDQRRYGMALYRHRQRLIALLECYSRRIKRGRARPTADGTRSSPAPTGTWSTTNYGAWLGQPLALKSQNLFAKSLPTPPSTPAGNTISALKGAQSRFAKSFAFAVLNCVSAERLQPPTLLTLPSTTRAGGACSMASLMNSQSLRSLNTASRCRMRAAASRRY
jgi:hypothetical protein